MRSLILAVGLLLLGWGCTLPQESSTLREGEDAPREIYLLNALAESISVLNPQTGNIQPHVMLTGQAPNDIHFYNDGLYVVNSGDNSLSLFNESSFESVGNLYLGEGRNPWCIIPVPGNSRAFVPNFLSGTVSLVDMDSLELTEEVDLGGSLQGGCFFNDRVFICDSALNADDMTFEMGRILVLDSENGELLNTIETGLASNPQAIIPISSQNELHVVLTGINGGTDSDDGMVLVLDGTDYSEVDRIYLGGSPDFRGSAIEEGRTRVYLSGVGGVMVYDYQTREIIHNSQDYLYPESTSANKLIGGVAVDEVNDRLFLCDFSSDSIVQLSLSDYASIVELSGGDGVQIPLLVEE